VPLANSEIAAVSRRARDRWLQQDSTVLTTNGHARSRSPSPTNETIYAGGTIRSGHSRPRPAIRTPRTPTPGDAMDHGCRCDNCNEWIMGRRFQCANCPSEPKAFNLVSQINLDMNSSTDDKVLYMRNEIVPSSRSPSCLFQIRKTGRYTFNVDPPAFADLVQRPSWGCIA
jgi:hypothetical protein